MILLAFFRTNFLVFCLTLQNELRQEEQKQQTQEKQTLSSTGKENLQTGHIIECLLCFLFIFIYLIIYPVVCNILTDEYNNKMLFNAKMFVLCIILLNIGFSFISQLQSAALFSIRRSDI